MTRGTPPVCALYSIGRAAAIPGPVCRFKNPGFPDARAYPSAIPAQTISLRPRIYRISGASSSASMNKISVAPGIPKTYSTPSARINSTRASLPSIIAIFTPPIQRTSVKSPLPYLGAKRTIFGRPSISLTNFSRGPNIMQFDWQCLTQAGSSPCWCLLIHKSQRSVG